MKESNSNTTKQVFSVIGLNCTACAGSAESMVKNQKGVTEASVNFATAQLTVVYNPAIISATQIQQSVRSLGFDLLIEDEAKQEKELETINRKKIKQLKKRTLASLILSVPLVGIGMFHNDAPYSNITMFLLSTPVVIWFGRAFFINAVKQARHRNVNMDTLVSISTGLAYLFSLFNMLYPEFWISRGLTSHLYFEAAAVIITFVLLGKLLEENAKDNTSTAIKKLLGLRPKTVTLIQSDGVEVETDIDSVKRGDLLLIKPGEKVAVDGAVIEGKSYVDESMLSGEPIPVKKEAGDTVYAGTINQKGSFRYRADKIGKETMLAQIIKIVQEAQGSKAPVQRLVDKIARIFVPTVIAISVLTLILWLTLEKRGGIEHGLLAAITVLVISCPCALGLATPTAIVVGVGKAAENGILIKDAESVESAKNINAIVFDKTGTITEGKPAVTQSLWLNKSDKELKILIAIEKLSEHPIAEAIVKNIDNPNDIKVSDFEEITGRGIRAIIDNKTYYVGTQALLNEKGIEIAPELAQSAAIWSKQANTIVWFADGTKAKGVLAIADKINPTAAKTVEQLKAMGIDIYMLTGDNKETAQAISQQAGIKHFFAEMLPADKANFVTQLQQQGKRVAVVGDGINDSAALAAANIGIAMGKGSDIAIDVAKMTIISSDLTKVTQAIRLSKQTVSTIKQNLFWAFIYNMIGIPIAAGILFPINGFLLNPMIAGAAMALSSVSVVTNSLLLKWKK